MGNQVDNRVVQLEMQNDSFEKGANQSIKTLDKLDNALNLKNGKRSFSEVEAAAEKCNFSPLLNAADKVIGKFSALEIAGITALSNITNRAVNAGINMAKSLSVDQITSGFSKYQQKTANVQTLVNSTGKSIDEINQYLDRLMWFSDETSYGFTDMTQALATMVNAGGDIDKIVPMIEGMANATAFAGKGAAEFNRVIYNLNQSYSQGFLTYMDWKSVQMAGANSKQLVETLIRAGEEAGTIKKGEVTIDNFTRTLSKRWANREVMEKAFGYFDEMTQKAYEMIGTVDEQGNKIENATQAYDILAKKYNGVSINAAKAAQEAKSLTEAIDSTKDAVSSGWMRTFEIIIGNYDQAKELWSSVADGLWTIFAGGFEARNDMLQEAFQTEPVEDYAKSLEKAGIKFDEFRHKMAKAYADKVGMPEWMTFTDFEATISKATNFSELLKESWVNSSLLGKTIEQFAPEIGSAGKATKALSVDIREVLKDVNSGKYGYGIAQQQKNLIKAGIDGSALGKNWLRQWYNAVGSKSKKGNKAIEEINKSLNTTVETVEFTSEAYDELKQKAKDFDNSYYASNSGRTIMLAGIANVLKAIGDRLGTVKNAWDEAFPMITAERLKGMLITFHRFSETLKMSEAEGHLIAAVSNRVFANLSKIKDILGSIGSVAISAIKLGGRFGDWFIHLKPVQEALGRIKDYLGIIDDGLGSGLDSVNNSIRNFAIYLDQIDNGDFDKLPDKFKKLAKFFSPVIAGWKKLKKASLPVIASIGNFLMNSGMWIYSNVITPFAEFVSSVIHSEKPIQTLIDGIKQFGSNAFALIKKVIDAVKNFKFSDAISELSNKFPAVATAIDKVSEAFKKLTTNADGTKKSLDFSKVISAITFAGLIGAVAELAHALTTIQKAADTIKTTFANINKVVTRKFTNRFEKNVYAVAYAVVAFAASIYVLSKIPEEKLKAAVGSILALMVALGILSAVMTFVAKRLSNKNIKALNGLAKPMLALSTSLLILSLAAKKMSSAFDGLTGFEETMTRVVGILALVGGLGLELIGFATLMMLMKGKIAASAIVLVVIATAILMMASAINSIADVKLSDDAKLILDRIIMVGAIVAAIASFGNPANVKGFSTFTNIIVSLAALAAAMYFGMLALQKMKEFKYEDVINSLDKVAIILGIVIGLGFILQRLSKSIQPITKAIARLSIAVFALIGAMYLISLLVGKLSAMADTGNIDAGVRAMISIALAVAMLMAVMGASLKISGNDAKGAIKMATSLLIIVVAMAGIVAVLKTIDLAFGNMTARSIAKIAHIFGGIVLVIAALSLAIGYAGKLGEGKGIGVLIAALADIVVLTAVLIILTNFSWSQLWPGLVAIIGVAAAIGLVMFAVGKAVAAANKNGKGTRGLLAAALVLISVGAALAIVASQPWGSIVAAGIVMVVALAAVSWAISYLSKTKVNLQSLGAIVAAIAVLLTIAFAIKLVVPALIAITSVPWQSLLVNTLILVGAIGILVAGFMLLSTFVGTVPPAIAVLAVVAVTLVAIGVLFVAFAASMAILANVNYGAIVTGLLLCIDPMSQIGTIAIGLILGAVGVALFAGAIALLGLAGKYSAAGITAFGIALEYLLGILSAVGNAVQNSNGSIIGALANLRGELAASAESVEKDASRMKTALSNINSADVIDTEGLLGDAKSAVSQMADGIDQNSGEIKNAAVGAITSAGEAATQEAGIQGKTAGEAFAANYYAAKEAGYQNMLMGQDGIGFTRMDPNMGMTNAPAKQEEQEAPKTNPTEMVKSWLGTMGTDLANYDFSSMASSFGGNLMSSIGTYLSGTGINDFMTQLTGTFSEGDFTGVTDTIANVFGLDLTNSLTNQESTDAMKDAGEEMMDKATEGAKKVDASPAGVEWANEVGSGMSGQKGAIESIARSLANAAMAAFKANWHPESLMSMASYASYDDDVAAYSDDYDVEPMSITPVLDMSEVDAAVDDFGTVYTPTIRPTLDMSGADPAYANVSAVSARNTQKESGYEVETTRGTEQPSSVNFVQNNYSPKNLSRVDIYRQTRNQLDMFEGMIKKK